MRWSTPARGGLRPVFLTSVTTVAGLLPILLERSFQAQIVIPMATSLGFGLLLATVLVLFLVPTLYYVYAMASGNAHATGHDDEFSDAEGADYAALPDEPVHPDSAASAAVKSAGADDQRDW